MQEYCHRCGGELPTGSGETPFCPQCGAPQLTLALEQQSIQPGAEAEGMPGTAVADAGAARSRAVEWKTAIQCALVVTAVAAALALAAVRADALKPVTWFWVMSGSLITLGLYQKRRPAAWMDARVGARIGVVAGLCLALGLGAVLAGWGVVDRYALHGMKSFDTVLAAQMLDAQRQYQQRMAAEQVTVPPEVLAFAQSPEFRAGMMLAGFAILSVILLLVSTLGGAFAGLLRMRRRQV
jgi:hypothetical protein